MFFLFWYTGVLLGVQEICVQHRPFYDINFAGRREALAGNLIEISPVV